MEIIDRPGPPTGIRRRLWRLPVQLYRLRLGWLTGGRLMLLTHTGRATGLPRTAVIEVVQHDADGYVSASGFGPRADWYRNVQRNPDVTITVGSRVIPATAHPLTSDEGADLMAAYAPRHPALARHLCRVMGFRVDGSTADYREVGARIPFVRFTPRR
jgi:deazaflavin-dependent oxidoreductase (nitroreductase family)